MIATVVQKQRECPKIEADEQQLFQSWESFQGKLALDLEGVHAKHVRQFLDEFSILWRDCENTAIFGQSSAVCSCSKKSLTPFACTRSWKGS